MIVQIIEICGEKYQKHYIKMHINSLQQIDSSLFSRNFHLIIVSNANTSDVLQLILSFQYPTILQSCCFLIEIEWVLLKSRLNKSRTETRRFPGIALQKIKLKLLFQRRGCNSYRLKRKGLVDFVWCCHVTAISKAKL